MKVLVLLLAVVTSVIVARAARAQDSDSAVFATYDQRFQDDKKMVNTELAQRCANQVGSLFSQGKAIVMNVKASVANNGQAVTAALNRAPSSVQTQANLQSNYAQQTVNTNLAAQDQLNSLYGNDSSKRGMGDGQITPFSKVCVKYCDSGSPEERKNPLPDLYNLCLREDAALIDSVRQGAGLSTVEADSSVQTQKAIDRSLTIHEGGHYEPAQQAEDLILESFSKGH